MDYNFINDTLNLLGYWYGEIEHRKNRNDRWTDSEQTFLLIAFSTESLKYGLSDIEVRFVKFTELRLVFISTLVLCSLKSTPTWLIPYFLYLLCYILVTKLGANKKCDWLSNPFIRKWLKCCLHSLSGGSFWCMVPGLCIWRRGHVELYYHTLTPSHSWNRCSCLFGFSYSVMWTIGQQFQQDVIYI